MLAQYMYRHSRYFALFVLCIVAVGLTSLQSIPRQEDPNITNFVGSITTFYPGATPDRVEALVSKPLEEELRKITEIDELRSISSSGISFFNIRLLDHLPDESLERVWTEVRDAMNDAARQFPQGAGAPQFDNDRFASFTAIIAVTAADGSNMSLPLLNRFALDLSDQARNLAGTKLVNLFGDPDEEIRVDVNEQQLLSRGLSLRHVSQALAAADAKAASGKATGQGTDLLIEVQGKFDSLERIRKVVVNTSEAGSTTRIADLGRVYKTAVTPPGSIAKAAGRDAILVGIVMQEGQQVDEWSQSLRELLDRFRSQAPAGLQLEITYDESRYAMDRLNAVATNLVIGVALVLLVMLFTLGWRAAVVVAVILPVCGLFTITIMDRMGMALHQMSISGLIVSLGLLVDGSIVMTDEVRKRLHRGVAPLQAIAESVNRLRAPLLASAITTILTFLPMAIVEGPAGDFVGSIAKAVIIMLSVSTLLALTITPILAVWLLPSKDPKTLHWTSRGINSGRMGRQLSNALDWSLQHPVGAIALALALPISGFLAFPTLTAQFFPGSDRNQLYIEVKLPDGRSIYDTQAVAKSIDQHLANVPLILRVDWVLGENAPAFYYNMYRTKEGIASYAQALVLTKNFSITDDLIRQLQSELDRNFPEARIIVRGIDQGPPVLAPLEVEITGPDLAVLQSLGEQFRGRLESIPYVTHTSADLIGGAPKLMMQLDEDKLRLAQLQLSDASRVLNDSLRGVTGGEILESTERLPVRVRLKESDWGTSDQIMNLRIPNTHGVTTTQLGGVPLHNLGEVKLVPAQSPITRFNGERINTIQAFLQRGILPEEALKQFRQNLEHHPIDLPAGYRLRYGGDSDERQRVVSKLMAPMGIIVALMVITIVMTFNSWRLSAVAGIVCVCSIGLSLFSLAAFGYPFGIQAVIGVIGSIGVSINAAIIILTALQQNDEACNGDLIAARSIVMDSSRHIISTTVTTFGGFLPLILSGGGFWPPFAMAIAGGVLLSTLVSFFLVPPMFILCSKMRPIRCTVHDSTPNNTKGVKPTPITS